MRLCLLAAVLVGCGDDGGAGDGAADALPGDARAPGVGSDARVSDGSAPDARRPAPDAAQTDGAQSDGSPSDGAANDGAVDASQSDAQAPAPDAAPPAPDALAPLPDATLDAAAPDAALLDAMFDAAAPDAARPDAMADAAAPDALPEDAAPPCRERVSGRVVADGSGEPIAGARVTLLRDDEMAFFEARTDAAGFFEIDGVPDGRYAGGASSRGRAYVEQVIDLDGACLDLALALGPETERGRWDRLGDPGERFGGTNSGVLLPDGRVIWCHDTRDPVIFDPAADGHARFQAGADSGTIQGCHAVSVLDDGRVLYVGGADRPVYGPGTRQVKLYDAVADRWTVMEDPQRLNDARWYPSLAPLPGGGFLTMGGGGLDNPVRIRSTEVLDPVTLRWRRVGDLAIGNEVSPVVLLFTGEVLMTHRPPQLYDPATEQWRLAGDFVQGPRMPNGDHADHEMVLLPDGRVAAIGYKSFVAGQPGQMLEVYDPAIDRWSLGAPVHPVRSRPSIVMLPDRRVLVMGGAKEERDDPTPVNRWNQVALTDAYDPTTDTWRRLADMNLAREYHAMPILLPDGRVLVTGGEEAPGNEPSASVVEVFSPPYLFRGPRPRITELAERRFAAGDEVRFRVQRTRGVTGVALLGAIATTHFMDSGPGRYLDLDFQQAGDEVVARLPAEAARAVPGHYILVALVDDVPSEGVMVSIRRP
jgi:hypothetical protein